MTTQLANPVHLNVHSWYSLLRATASVEALAARAAQDGMTHLALADTNVLYGAVAFQRASLAAGVQPIIGMTATVAPPNGMTTHHAPGELTLLATGAAGYRSLCRLSSTLQGVLVRAGSSDARLTWDEIKDNQEGLICLSGGRRGWVHHLLRLGETAAAGRVVSWLAGVFGERAWLTIDAARPGDAAFGKAVETLAARFGIGAVVAHAIYCLAPEERDRLQLLSAIARNTTLTALTAADRLDDGDDTVALALAFAAGTGDALRCLSRRAGGDRDHRRRVPACSARRSSDLAGAGAARRTESRRGADRTDDCRAAAHVSTPTGRIGRN
jgi:DNA polymerase-3 subunit alpha